MFGAWKPKPSGMRRWDGSHCLFRRIGASKSRCYDKTSKFRCFDTITVAIDTCLVRGDPSQVGCGGGMARIVYFVELGLRKHDVTTKPRRFPVLTRPSSRLEYVRCVETQAKWDAAADSLEFVFRRIGASKTRCHDDTSKIPCFKTITVEVGMCSARGDPS